MPWVLLTLHVSLSWGASDPEQTSPRWHGEGALLTEHWQPQAFCEIHLISMHPPKMLYSISPFFKSPLKWADHKSFTRWDFHIMVINGLVFCFSASLSLTVITAVERGMLELRQRCWKRKRQFSAPLKFWFHPNPLTWVRLPKDLYRISSWHKWEITVMMTENRLNPQQ